METEIAIWVRGVTKKYGGKTGKIVLDDLDMTVKKGSMCVNYLNLFKTHYNFLLNPSYGLLGASGCGKTTLLSAIVGNKKIDAGQIRILGKLPQFVKVRTLGYMPQEIALVGEFTVKGAIEHYGWLFGMTNDEIDQRYEFLQKLLDLPPKDRLIKNLR